MSANRRPRAPRARSREARADEALEDPWTPEKLGFVLVGTIVSAHGVRGEVRVRVSTDFPRERLGVGRHERFLLLPGRRYPRPITVHGGREASQQTQWITLLEGVRTRDGAEKLRGAQLYVRAGARPRMARDEFLVGELVGMMAKLEDGREVGKVVSVITREEICKASGGGAAAAMVAADMLEIEVGGETTLVPFVKRIVPHVNRKEKVIVLTPPEGLLEIARVNNKYVPPPPRGLLMAAKD